MPKVVACFKWVIDEADLRFGAGGAVDSSKAKWKISEYDRNAIEEAVLIAKDTGRNAVCLTYGSSAAEKSLKDALSRGPESAVLVCDDAAESADGARTAQVLAAAVKQIEDADLVLCADGAGDTFARQTAPRIAAALDWPVVTSAVSIKAEEGKAEIQRKTEVGLQTICVQLPAVVSVLPEINKPSIPTMKAVLGAKKKPVERIDAAQLDACEPKVACKGLQGYQPDRKNLIIDEGDMQANAKALAEALRKEGVL